MKLQEFSEQLLNEFLQELLKEFSQKQIKYQRAFSKKINPVGISKETRNKIFGENSGRIPGELSKKSPDKVWTYSLSFLKEFFETLLQKCLKKSETEVLRKFGRWYTWILKQTSQGIPGWTIEEIPGKTLEDIFRNLPLKFPEKLPEVFPENPMKEFLFEIPGGNLEENFLPTFFVTGIIYRSRIMCAI